jgi:peroxiredoxin
MTIKEGDTLPDATLSVMGEKGPQQVSVGDLFKGKKVALFALPGAFTPTCSAKHLPGFLTHADDLKAKGIDSIVCLSVNDAFVMNA